MSLVPRVCYRALQSRDARFDGRFFVGVLSTGIYCRPICPARTPRFQNVRFFLSHAGAEEDGFRACLRCRPETAPGSPAWLGTSVTVRRGVRLIAEGALDRGGTTELAQQLGVGTRHLRRLFQEHLGASPIAIAQTRRVHSARRLLEETDLPMTQVAWIAGFKSQRRFNAAIKQVFRRTPREIRRTAKIPPGDFQLRFAYRPPYAWDQVLSFFHQRAIPGLEWVGPSSYGRVFATGESQGSIEVTNDARASQLLVRVRVDEPAGLLGLSNRLRVFLDLCADPLEIESHLSQDQELQPIVDQHRGLRVPGAWDGFEIAVRAILGQQIQLAAARTIAGRLVARAGEPVGEHFAFPTPEAILAADLQGLGLTGRRVEALQALAQAVSEGLPLTPSADPTAVRAALAELPGIGPWTIEYIAMRALRDPDAFPASDLVLRKNRSGEGHCTPAQLARRAEAWRPWRAYAAVHLWAVQS